MTDANEIGIVFFGALFVVCCVVVGVDGVRRRKRFKRLPEPELRALRRTQDDWEAGKGRVRHERSSMDQI